MSTEISQAEHKRKPTKRHSRVFWSFWITGIGYAVIVYSMFPEIQIIRHMLLVGLLILAISTYLCLEALFLEKRRFLTSFALALAILPFIVFLVMGISSIRG